jgi:hypothetical protein
MIGSSIARVGMRISNPTLLTIRNSPSIRICGLDRESGKVHKLFQVKLLRTAAMNEIVAANTEGKAKTLTSKFLTPKSTIAPIVPTMVNRKKRVLSRGFDNIVVM